MKLSSSRLSLVAIALAACGGGTSGNAGPDGGASDPDAGPDCGGVVCVGETRCRYDVCVPDLGDCDTNDDCPGDSYCDANGECIPYGVPPDVENDPECVRPDTLDEVTPVVQCEWSGTADPDDPTAGSIAVYSAPIVADLNLDNDPARLQPSVILTTWENVGVRIGTLRVFDGRTCAEQLRAGGADEPTDENRPAYGTQWAVGDLDGDVPGGGRPEIVGLHKTTGDGNTPLELYAFRLEVSGGQASAERLWYGRDCATGEHIAIADNQANFGPGIWDLDDDGVPEILIDSMVFDADGCLISQLDPFDYITHGRMNTIADADLDGAPELIMADRIAAWDPAGGGWTDESYFAPSSDHKPGHTAIVDLGQYSELPGMPVPNELPEVIVVSAETTAYDPDSTGTIRVQNLAGDIIWGPMDLYFTPPETAGGHGGPPTASDFDGDGQVEFAAAANQYYVVYDPDCDAAGVPAERPGGACTRAPDMQGLPDGILWAQLSQDRSSSGTGSSIFDFNADGASEAVYGDECYVRVYEGATGQVIFSSPASNGTGFELPVIADVDGDFATEIVVARSPKSGCPSPDPLFPASGDFASTGGLAILRDPMDRWASSRPVWNQHAYSITNVTDDARIPRSSQVVANWTDPELNNFRQNNQGDLGVFNIADLTVVMADIEDICQGLSGPADLDARVCNRGTNPVQDGVTVEFSEGGTSVCTTATSRLLRPGECEQVTCSGQLSGTRDVAVTVDPSGDIADCHPGNNDGASSLQLCIE